jgi:DNA-binding response OmpR family regulator
MGRAGSARTGCDVVKKILIVEDDLVGARALADFLGAHGYETVVARTGPEGIERFQRDEPDLILVDVQLPLRNGFEVAFAVRRSAGGSDLPIVLMSAVYTDVDHATAYATEGLQAQGYFVKPFPLREMLDRVQALIGP